MTTYLIRGTNGNDVIAPTFVFDPSGSFSTHDSPDDTDVVSAFDGNDILLLGLGDDQALGGSGDDFIVGDGGADAPDGGSGTDLATYETSPAGVVVNLVAGKGEEQGYGAGDTLVNIENLCGSNHDDVLIGTPDSNVLEGLAGDDLLIGFSGADVLSGGPGRDAFAISSVSEGGDIITDFDPAAGETIQLATLFAAHALPAANALGDGIVQVAALGAGSPHSVLNLDLDRSAGDAAPFTFYTLLNVTPADLNFGTHILDLGQAFNAVRRRAVPALTAAAGGRSRGPAGSRLRRRRGRGRECGRCGCRRARARPARLRGTGRQGRAGRSAGNRRTPG
jgi:Ca2+-binding RTX toxin-like protein